MAGEQHSDTASAPTPRPSASPPILRVQPDDATTTRRQRLHTLAVDTPNAASAAAATLSSRVGHTTSPVPVLSSPPQAGSTRRLNQPAIASSRQQRLPTIPTVLRPSPYTFDDRAHARTSSAAVAGKSPPTPTLQLAQSTRHQHPASSMPHSYSSSVLSSQASNSTNDTGGSGGGGGGGHKPFVPQRRLARKHGRFQLWASGVLLSLALCHSLIGLISDNWLEDAALNHSRLEGKGPLQWVLVSLGSLCGLIAYALLVVRFFGWHIGTRAKGSLVSPKVLIIMWIVADAACVLVATRQYMSAGEYALRTGRVDRAGDVGMGSGYNFVQDSFYYLIACILLLSYHEIDEWRLRRARAREKKKTVREREEPHHHTASDHSAPSSSNNDHPHPGGSSPDPSHSGRSPDLEVGASSSSWSSLAEGGGASAAANKSAADLSPPPLGRFSVVLHHDYLSPPQRRFVFAVSLFFVWIYFGAVVFTLVEGWNIRVSADFCLTTLATIGFGNVTPHTTLGRCILFVYFPIGFASLGFAVNLVWQVVLAKLNSRVRHVSAWVAGSLENGCLGRHFGANAKQKRKEAAANKKKKHATKHQHAAENSGEARQPTDERQPLSPQRPVSPQAVGRPLSKDATSAVVVAAAAPSALIPARRARPPRSTSPPSSGSSRSNSPSHGEDIGLTSPGATQNPRSHRPRGGGGGGGGGGARAKKHHENNTMNIFELADEIAHHEERERQRMEDKSAAGGKSMMNAATAAAPMAASFRLHQRTESTDSTSSMHESHPLTSSHASQLAASTHSHPPTPSGSGSHPDRLSFSSIASRPGAPSISSARSSSSTASSGSRAPTSQLLGRSAEMDRVEEEDASGLASPPPPPKPRSPVVPKLQPPPPPPPAPPAVEAPSPAMEQRPSAEGTFGRPHDLSPREASPTPPPHLLVRTQSQPTAGPGDHSSTPAYRHQLPPLSTTAHSRMSSYSSDVRAYRDFDRSTGAGAPTATRFPHHHHPHYPPSVSAAHMQQTGASMAASMVHEASDDPRSSVKNGGAGSSSRNITRALSKLQRKKNTTSVQLSLAFCFVLIWMLASSAVFSWSEGWSLFESFYFCYVCLTTIGFGDFVPSNNVANIFFLWFVICGLGAVIYLLSLVGELLTERFEQRVLSRRKAQSAKARKKALLKELENQEAIFAPPESLLDHAQEFSLVTAELVARAKANMTMMKAGMTDLFTVQELQRYQIAFSALLRAEEKRKNTFDQAWMKAMQRVVHRPAAASFSAASSSHPIADVHSPSHSDHEFEWSNVGSRQSYLEADPTLYPFQPQLQPGQHSRPGSRTGVGGGGGPRSPPMLQHPPNSGRPHSLSPMPSAHLSPYQRRRELQLHHHASFDAPGSQPSSPIPEEDNLGPSPSPLLVDQIVVGTAFLANASAMSPRSIVPPISISRTAAADPAASLYDPTPQPEVASVRDPQLPDDQQRLQPEHSPKSDDDDIEDEDEQGDTTVADAAAAAITSGPSTLQHPHHPVDAVDSRGELEPEQHDLVTAMALRRHHSMAGAGPAAEDEEEEAAAAVVVEDPDDADAVDLDDDDDPLSEDEDERAGFEFDDGDASEVDSDEENAVSEVRRTRHAHFEVELDDEEAGVSRSARRW